MTKNLFKSSILYIFVLFFSACSNPVFYNISKEVRLQDATVMGSINSIVRFTQNGKEYLVCQNGNTLYYKETGTDRVSNESVWTARPNKTFPSFYYSYEEGDYKGEYVLKCAADSNFVYLLTAELRIDLDRGEAVPKCYRLYSTNDLASDSWTLLESFSKNLNSYISDNVYKGYPLLFCTNSINTANRVAFIRNNDTANTNNTQSCKYYKLSGASEPAEITPPESRLDGTT